MVQCKADYRTEKEGSSLTNLVCFKAWVNERKLCGTKITFQVIKIDFVYWSNQQDQYCQFYNNG